MAKASVDLPDPDLPQNASTPPGPAVAPAWSTCPQPRACKITGCNIRENAWTTVSRDAFASGHTRTRCSPTEKTNTPTPGQTIQCKFTHENAPHHTSPQSSIQLLTSRPVEGGGVSPPINRSVNGPASAGTPSRPPLSLAFGLEYVARIGTYDAELSPTALQHRADVSDALQLWLLPSTAILHHRWAFIECFHGSPFLSNPVPHALPYTTRSHNPGRRDGQIFETA